MTYLSSDSVRNQPNAWRVVLILCAFFFLAPCANASDSSGQAAPVRVGLATGTLIVPEGFSPDKEGAVHVLMTLHSFERGVQEFLDWNEPHWALVAVHNPGFSSVYRRLFERPQLFLELIDESRQALEEHTGVDSLTVETVWIAAFSAGYAGAREILADPQCYERLDGLILLDCPHTGYTETGEVVPHQMEHFVRFALDAVQGDKRFLITHSEIVPGTYASTTECADYLLNAAGMERKPMSGVNDEEMSARSQAWKGKFTIYGFAGEEAPHHMQHLYSLDQWLRDDWIWNVE